MPPETKKQVSRKPYRPPKVRSERILVPDLFQPSNCDPIFDPRPECQ
jgi:hypothetical protein